MPRARLSDVAVKALRPPGKGQVTHWDSTLPCFGLRVAAGGAKSWVIQYRVGAQVRRLTLGRYPVLGLADARARAKEALAGVVQGEDPAAEKRSDREAASFEVVAHAFIEDAKAKGRRSWPEMQRALDHDVLPGWRKRRAKDITARDVRELLDAIVSRGAPIQANRTFAVIRRLFN